jgi:hypothetical protein
MSSSKPAHPSAARVLGSGVPVKDWIARHPDRFVTRRDMGLLFAMYENAQQRHRRRWWRRLWHWLVTPVLHAPPLELAAKEDPSTRA